MISIVPATAEDKGKNMGLEKKSGRREDRRATSGPPLLSIKNLVVSYGKIRALQGISFDVYPGEIVTLIGANGAGKSTTLRAISGMIPVESGDITFASESLLRLSPDAIVRKGIAHVPEGRGIFANLTVLENLKLATFARRDRDQIANDLERVFTIFPRLKERRNQLGGTLSGGEQQMLAVGRALMTRSRLIFLDEPSMGLSPVMVQEIFRIIQEIHQAGVTILLVEQNAQMALKVAHYCYVLETGRITLAATPEELRNNPLIREAYLGG
ncbi:high-affinity branched-chain amino acid transport ATP-binding protein LivF [Moorella thermoacetica]|nr:high-affinity branched-chain amino acid transport ATP-binding protein LivF [Moorella thermoacetica]